jgi:hypothetical protein
MVAALLLSISGVLSAAMPAAFAPRGAGGGGALFSPSFSPDGQELTVACDMSDLFDSPDRGLSWTLTPFQQVQGGRSSAVLWSGAVRYSVDNSTGSARLVASADGGATWKPLATDPTQGNGVYNFSAHPSAANHLLATGWDSLYVSKDGGTTWKSIEAEPDAGAGVLLGGAFWDGADVYLGTNGGLFVSHDSGWTFAPSPLTFPTGQRLIALTGGRSGSTVRLFAATAPVGDVYNGVAVEDFHSSTPALWTWTTGATGWTSSHVGIDTTHRLYLLGQASTTIDTLYAAGGIYQTDWPEIYRSVDGGSTWTEMLGATGNVNVATGWAGSGGDHDWSYGGSACGFGVASGNGHEIAYTDYGFVHVSDDGGLTWRQAYVDPRDQNPAGASTPTGRSYRSVGLENTSVWGLAWSDSLHLFAGFTDIRGLRSSDGGNSWGFGYTGLSENTTYRVFRAADGILYAATSTVHDMYQSTHLTDARDDGSTGQILSSNDGGATWNVLWTGKGVVWIEPDPNDSQTVYASVVHSTQGGILATHNLKSASGATWAFLPAPSRTQGHPYTLSVLPDGSLLSSWSGRIDNTGAFTASSGVFLLPKGSSTWQDLSDPGMKYWTKSVVVDPSDRTGHTWWAGVFSGWGGLANGLGGLYRTADAGSHWSRVWSADGVESVGLPSDSAELFFTTSSSGLWYAPDRTSSSPAFSQVPSYPFRQPVRVLFNPYDPAETWVTSFGNGLRVGRRDGDAVGIAPRSATEAGLTVRRSGQLIELSGLDPDHAAKIQVVDLSGRLLRSASVVASNQGRAALDVPSFRGVVVIEAGRRSVLLTDPRP